MAAGAGTRAGGGVVKQFREIAGIPMVLRTVRPFLAHPAVRAVALVVPSETASAPPGWLAGLVGERLRLVAGGAQRIDSVEQGVSALESDMAVILVHDGARPFVERSVIDAVIGLAREGVGAVAAVPVSDTIKQVRPDDPSRTIAATVPREGLWRAQTPQAFPRALLLAGFRRARALGMIASDDAAMVEASGGTVRVVPDLTTNLKITTADDFMVAESMARGMAS